MAVPYRFSQLIPFLDVVLHGRLQEKVKYLNRRWLVDVLRQQAAETLEFIVGHDLRHENGVRHNSRDRPVDEGCRLCRM